MLQQIGYLWAVTAVVWLGTAFYVISLVRRQQHLQKELQQLEKTLAELGQTSGRG
ncbi:CcmD family protein [Alicyclobacillus curvatus]|nr:CcmD family protein [Alicyclobacillus curvatus]